MRPLKTGPGLATHEHDGLKHSKSDSEWGRHEEVNSVVIDAKIAELRNKARREATGDKPPSSDRIK